MISGDMKNGYFAVGRVSKKGGEIAYVGDRQSAKFTLSVSYAKDAEGKDKWLNCIAWWELAELFYAMNVGANDIVRVWGNMQKRTYNEKDYYDLLLDDLEIRHKGEVKEYVPQNSGFEPIVEEIDEDDLPF